MEYFAKDNLMEKMQYEKIRLIPQPFTENNFKKDNNIKESDPPKEEKIIFNTGRWTQEEHLKFIDGILEYGNEWKKVQSLIKTRSSTQARSHAQKFFLRIKKSLSQKEQNYLSNDNENSGQDNFSIKYFFELLSSSDKNKGSMDNEKLTGKQREKLLSIVSKFSNIDYDDGVTAITSPNSKKSMETPEKTQNYAKKSSKLPIKIFEIKKDRSRKESINSCFQFDVNSNLLLGLKRDSSNNHYGNIFNNYPANYYNSHYSQNYQNKDFNFQDNKNTKNFVKNKPKFKDEEVIFELNKNCDSNLNNMGSFSRMTTGQSMRTNNTFSNHSMPFGNMISPNGGMIGCSGLNGAYDDDLNEENRASYFFENNKDLNDESENSFDLGEFTPNKSQNLFNTTRPRFYSNNIEYGKTQRTFGDFSLFSENNKNNSNISATTKENNGNPHNNGNSYANGNKSSYDISDGFLGKEHGNEPEEKKVDPFYINFEMDEIKKHFKSDQGYNDFNLSDETDTKTKNYNDDMVYDYTSMFNEK